ncbi:MAG: phytanoyl-CoA dioxygenase family protein [Myxococcales bacterium]|nr:phytanoyl-CoA dioxygenase family protein [Myxococcales bacterium]
MRAEVVDDESLEEARGLPLTTRFQLGSRIEPVQHAFLKLHGFLVFDQVATSEEVQLLLDEAERVQQRLLDERREQVFGVPVWVGRDPDGGPFLQRLAFTSVFSDAIHAFVRDPRFEPLRQLVGQDARIGDREKDGVVLNRYINGEGSLRPGVGWHTDGLRDVFYNWRMPLPQLNVGLHLTRVGSEDGGLRILPGTHTQGLFHTLFRKAYFVSQKPDPNEIVVQTEPGDLTVHDGRLWHRVAPSPKEGWDSMRVSMYVPYVTDRYSPKSEDTKPLLYHRVFDAVMRARRRRSERDSGRSM